MEFLNFQTVIVELLNGQTRHFPMNEFDYFAFSNELEHKEENIVVSIGNIAKSFIYETDERGEIVDCETISRITFI